MLRLPRKELKEGNSVAVSGVCLTALDIKPDSFCADLAAETWTRTSFSRITARRAGQSGAAAEGRRPHGRSHRAGTRRRHRHASSAWSRFANADDFWLHIDVPEELEKYLVFKGSIAIEGISLTVAKLEGSAADHRHHSSHRQDDEPGSLKPGDPVNIETDIVAKYLEKWTQRDERSSARRFEQIGLRLVAQGYLIV